MKTYTHLNDHELILLYLSGDVPAFTALVERYKQRVFTSVLLLVKDRYLAEDIFQETFIRILKKLHEDKYAEDGKFLSWALTIARNICLDHFRKVKRTPYIVTSDHQYIFDVPGSASPAADHKILQKQTSHRIAKVLDMLPEEQKEVIILRHYADLSFKEIAVMTNCSMNTALGRMRYGLINLRKIMSEKQIALCVVAAIGQHI
jgi:RNA polymerase sigma factor (sigma-70 family)